MRYIFTVSLLMAVCLGAKAQYITPADTLGLDSNMVGSITISGSSGWVTTISDSAIPYYSQKRAMLAEFNSMYDKATKNVRKYRKQADAALKKGDITATIIAQREHNYWIGYHDAVTILINKYQ